MNAPTLEDVLKNVDLYGNEILEISLKQRYNYISYRRKSIPTSGSPTRCLKNCHGLLFKVVRYYFRKNNDLVIYTKNQVLLFTK